MNYLIDVLDLANRGEGGGVSHIMEKLSLRFGVIWGEGGQKWPRKARVRIFLVKNIYGYGYLLYILWIGKNYIS